MHPTLNIAIKAARKAGNVIIRSMDQLDTLSVTAKGRNDFVSEVDRQAEQEIIKIIRKAFPSHGILAEEGGFHEGDDYQWIIDPLDGTTNFLHGFPQFAVSIALQHKGRLEHAVVYDPLRQEIFSASRGAGAHVNERRIRVSKAKGLEGTLLGTGFPFRHMTHLESYIAILKDLIPQTAGIRRPGSAALDLAYVAAGRLDGFWEYGLQPWDIAAGALLVQEAGGILSDFTGGSDYMKSGNVVEVLKAIVQTIHRHTAG
ncbi:MAG: myo-inositol-1(or 4)-monophosphatase [Halothiobacillaceae bacterium]|nr:MAG: myo-inositol-1(or 4)-monophosphatase [Halothiobacillaceae bacterium]